MHARTLGSALYHYATDHGGKYPTGASSTEIFQKLIDGHYLTDPAMLFEPSLALPGKFPATSNALRPENVCWDVTIPVDSTSSDDLPLVFETGFRVTYVPCGSAMPVSSQEAAHHGGIWVYYRGLNASYFRADMRPDGILVNFVPPQFDPKGKVYVQLTPEGPFPEFRDLVNRVPKN